MASLAEEIGPYDALEYVVRAMGDNLTTMIKNLPAETDPAELQARKWAIIEVELKGLKGFTREGIKAREIGSASTAVILKNRQINKPLDSFQG